MVHDLKYFIFISKQVPINFALWCLRSRRQGMVFSCGCLAIMTLYIITDSINSWCESAPLINTELINCVAYTGSTAQSCLLLWSATGWKCLVCLRPSVFPQAFPQSWCWRSSISSPLPVGSLMVCYWLKLGITRCRFLPCCGWACTAYWCLLLQ